MPLKRCALKNGNLGWKWGDSGKCYPTKAEALRQARAIYATGWAGESIAVLPLFLESKWETQSVIFDKSKFTKAQARSWAKRHGYKTNSVDETEGGYRFRQTPPDRYKKFRNFKLDGVDGVTIVLGFLG